ncbi:MFS transporter [Streptomyces sp. NPDC049541]|uniref:MFS transporter n=1 Tax=Streptomyces sp. NPDC049541 TaxID=3365594 RepID=UPI0037ADEAC1
MSSTPVGRPSYAAVLRIPHARRTFAAALLGRLSYGIVPLSVVLAVNRASGSYTVAGTVMALFGATSVFLSPARAALIDRYGPRRTLVPMVTAYAALLGLLTLLVRRPGAVSPLVPAAVAAAAGACTPPLGPAMRAVWSRLAPDRALLQRAYSLDGVAEELLLVSGPVLVGILTGFAPPTAGIAFGTALIVAGTAGFVMSPAVGAARPADVGTGRPGADRGAGARLRGLVFGRGGVVPRPKVLSEPGAVGGSAPGERRPGRGVATQEALRGLVSGRGIAGRGALRRGHAGRVGGPAGVRRGVLLGSWTDGRSRLRRVRLRRQAGRGVLRGVLQPVVAAGGVGLTLGVVDLVVVAFAEQRHYGDGTVAWTLAALSAGSAVGGLVNGAVHWRVPAPVRLPLVAAGLGVALFGAGFAPGLGTLAVALAAAGFFVSPALTTAYLIADDAAAPAARVRVGAWVNTVVNAGSTAGAAVAGPLVGGMPTALCFAAAGTAALLTALATVRRSRARSTPGAVPERGEAESVPAA